MNRTKPKLAMYWGASCGGCEISLTNIHEAILEVDAHFDFMFCPCLLDTKKKDIEALPDGAIFLTLFNGALRTEENLEMAVLLRRKSQLVIAFGSCAVGGGIPALANQHGLKALLAMTFAAGPGLDNPGALIPGECQALAGVPGLPAFLARVQPLQQAVPVDYTLPGCPPEPESIIAVLRQMASGADLPPAGGLLGCSERALCDECPREKRGTLASALVRPFEALPEPGWCLLEQGFCCLGTSTRGGCRALCPSVNMPCTGCYGPLDRGADPGAAALTALCAAVAPQGLAGMDERALSARLRHCLSGVADPLGTAYRYSLATTVVAQRLSEVEP